ncbi:MAG TPA: hypothetical protein EYP07_05655 [Kiloniellaceae bacterium]|nr:hypothetical protein [Kiloniellaceae bacterium]
MTDDLDRRSRVVDFVRLDASKTFEGARESSDVRLDLIGEFSPSARFLAARPEIDLSAIAVGTYGEVDISAHLGGETAVAAFLTILSPSTDFFARAVGSALDLRENGDGRQPFIAPVNLSGRFEVYRASGARLFLAGYDTEGFVWTEGPDITATADEVWQDRALPPGATGALIWGYGASNQFGVRPDGSGAAAIHDPNARASFLAVEAPGGVVEVYREQGD